MPSGTAKFSGPWYTSRHTYKTANPFRDPSGVAADASSRPSPNTQPSSTYEKRGAVPSPLVWQVAGIEAPDRDKEAEDDGLRARRAAGDVDVDRQDPVDAAGARVSLPNDPPGRGAGSHGDHNAGVGDGLKRAEDGGLQVASYRTRDHDPVRMARGGDEIDAEATNVVHWVQEGGEF